MSKYLLLAMVILFLPSSPYAATVRLPETGQISCWDSAGNVVMCNDTLGFGQDGAARAGAAWPTPRFVDNGNGTVTDKLTGLIWLKKANCTDTVGGVDKSIGILSWTDALTWSNALDNGKCGLSDGSVSGDWRLANVKELRSLLNWQQADSAAWLNSQGFTGVLANNGYWTSTTSAGRTDSAWVVTMDDGDVGSYGHATTWVNVWPVRGGVPPTGTVSLPETGQTSCWLSGDPISCSGPIGSGQDGALRAGAAWPSPRFVDNGNGTVTDNLTGLIWLKNANCFGAKNWTTALTSANTLASGSCGLADGSLAGKWRLPNGNELESLINRQEGNNVTWLKTQGFPTVQDNAYWTASTYASSPGTAGIAYIGFGSMGARPKGLAGYVWPVRDPSSPLNDDTAFVRQVYLDFLNREPEQEGLTYWVSELQSGRRTRAEIVEQYLLSPEFGEKISPVARLYFAYFNRLPDYDGLMFWVNEYSSGRRSLDNISDFFAGSAEFQATYGSLSNADFVTLIYQNVLGRNPEPAGLAFWTSELNAGNRTRGQIMTGFSESQEYRDLMANPVYVTMTYIGLLRRAPEQDGYNYWVARMDDGDSGQVLIGLFLDSAEYKARFE